MKSLFTLVTALSLSALPLLHAADEATASFRRFTTNAGETFYGTVTTKNDLSVTFKLQDGRAKGPIFMRDMSQADQQFLRKWTKFKDDLMNNAQFAKLTVKEMLEMRGYQSFEVEIKENHIFIEGEMNGKPTRFMIDTGAGTSLLHTESAKAAGVEIGPFTETIRGLGGEAPAAVCHVTLIKLGDTKIENRKILATDMFKDLGEKGDHDAVFGADFLNELEAVISYREGRMFLKPENIKPSKPGPAVPGGAATVYFEVRKWKSSDNKEFVASLIDKTDKEATFRLQDGRIARLPIDRLSEDDKGNVARWDKLKDGLAKNPEWMKLTVKELLELRAYQSFAYRKAGNHILVDGTIAGTKANFLIDTGAFSGVLHTEFSKRAKLKVGPMDQIIHGIGGPAPAALTEVPVLTMGDATIENRTLLTADLFKDATAIGDRGDYDAIFGADFLRELDAVISYKEARMFLRPDMADKKAAKPAEVKPAEPAKPTEPATPAEPAEKPKKSVQVPAAADALVAK